MGGGGSKSKDKKDESEQDALKVPDPASGLSSIVPPAAEAGPPDEPEEVTPKPKSSELSPEEAGQWKAVHSAARWGKYDDVNRMVRSANVDLQDPINGNFTIHIAAQNGHLGVVELLIEKKASVNVQNKTGQTPLHMAIEYDYYSIVQALKAAGADDKITNNGGFMAITGIEGTKVIELVAFAAATTGKEFASSLEALNKQLSNDSEKERLDKATIVQTGMKLKKTCKEEWNSDPKINTLFMDLVRAL